MKTTLILILTLVSQLSLSADEKPLRPLVSFVGADTRIEKTDYLRITTRDAWIQLWLAHTGKPGTPAEYGSPLNPSGAPEIDFAQCMVVAIIRSPGSAVAGIKVVSVIERPDAVIFDYDIMAYQFTEGVSGVSAPGNAFGYFVLPLSRKPLFLRCNITASMSRIPAVWQEQRRFEALILPSPK